MRVLGTILLVGMSPMLVDRMEYSESTSVRSTCCSNDHNIFCEFAMVVTKEEAGSQYAASEDNRSECAGLSDAGLGHHMGSHAAASSDGPSVSGH